MPFRCRERSMQERDVRVPLWMHHPELWLSLILPNNSSFALNQSEIGRRTASFTLTCLAPLRAPRVSLPMFIVGREATKQRRWLAERSRGPALSLRFHLMGLLFWKADVIKHRGVADFSEHAGDFSETAWPYVQIYITQGGEETQPSMRIFMDAAWVFFHTWKGAGM